MTGTVSNVTRVESWSYFQPRIDPGAATEAPVGNPDYTFFGDRAELGVSVEGSRFDLSGAFNYVRLENLPTDAIGPGGLGSGAFYFAATGLSYSYQLYLGELTARLKSTTDVVDDWPHAIRIRRRVGVVEPVAPAMKEERLHSRLIGVFEWSYYQRRFDGVRFDLDRSSRHVTAAVFVPTQGGFEESANLSMPKVQVWSRRR